MKKVLLALSLLFLTTSIFAMNIACIIMNRSSQPVFISPHNVSPAIYGLRIKENHDYAFSGRYEVAPGQGATIETNIKRLSTYYQDFTFTFWVYKNEGQLPHDGMEVAVVEKYNNDDLFGSEWTRVKKSIQQLAMGRFYHYGIGIKNPEHLDSNIRLVTFCDPKSDDHLVFGMDILNNNNNIKEI